MSLARPVRKAPGVKVVRTASAFDCGPACGILAHVKGGVLVKVEPGDFPGTGHICARGLAALKMVYHPERLKRPMKRLGERGDGKWQEISWEEALSTIAAKLRQISDRYGSNSLAWTADMMGALTTSAVMGFAGACQGTFILPAGYGDSSGLCADATLYSTPMYYGESYTVQFDNPALCVVWGSNPAETECFKWRRIRDFKEKGARLVVVDPRFTTTASKADEYIPIRPGTDAALALGMMNVILDRGLQDTSFMIDYTVGPFLVRTDSGMFLREKDVSLGESEKYIVWDTQGSIPQRYDVPEVAPALAGVYKVKGVDCKPAFQLLADLVRQYPPDVASEITGVSADTIARLAIEYATKKPVASFRGMGGTRGNLYGDLNFRAISTLAALTGNISFEGRASFGTNFFALMSRGIPSLMPVLQMHEAILTGKPYPIKALWMVRINLINADPDFNKMVKEIVPRLELIVVADMFMSTSAQYADIVLPACSFYECTDLLSPIGFGSHNYLQLQQKVIEPLHESRSDFEIFASLAKTMGMDGYLDKSAEECIELLLTSDHPSMEGITLEKLKESPMPPAPHSLPAFSTPSGRLEFYSERLREFGQELPVYLEPVESPRRPLAQKYPLTFLTAHPKYRTHRMFANIPWLRELDPEPTLEMNPVDAAPRGIQDGDLVRVFNDRGEVKLRAKLHQGIRPGSVNICEGWAPSDYIEGTHQALTHDTINPAQQAVGEPNAAFYDTMVEVERAKEVCIGGQATRTGYRS